MFEIIAFRALFWTELGVIWAPKKSQMDPQQARKTAPKTNNTNESISGPVLTPKSLYAKSGPIGRNCELRVRSGGIASPPSPRPPLFVPYSGLPYNVHLVNSPPVIRPPPCMGHQASQETWRLQTNNPVLKAGLLHRLLRGI